MDHVTENFGQSPVSTNPDAFEFSKGKMVISQYLASSATILAHTGEVKSLSIHVLRDNGSCLRKRIKEKVYLHCGIHMVMINVRQ